MTNLSEYQGVVTCHPARPDWQIAALGLPMRGSAASHSRTPCCTHQDCGDALRSVGLEDDKRSRPAQESSRIDDFLVCERRNLGCSSEREGSRRAATDGATATL